MKYTKLSLVLATALSLTACGSDSNNQVDAPTDPSQPDPTQPERSVGWDYVETPFMDLSKNQLEGEVLVTFGIVDNRAHKWLKGLDGSTPSDLNGDGVINYYDVPKEHLNVMDDGSPLPKLTPIAAQDIIDVLATNPDGLGAGTARPDIFKEGNFSVFDLLRYMAVTRADMQFDPGSIVHYTDSDYDTFEFSFSWDRNGDGDFTNDGVYSASKNWHFATNASGGREHDGGNETAYIGHRPYGRMDNYWLRPSMEVRFRPFSDTMTKRRQWVWSQEIARKEANDGKYIVPKVQYFNVMTGQITVYATDVEVKSFNMLPGVFQEGVIQPLDVFLTLAQEQGMDFSFTYWPIMSSGAVVNTFAMSRNPSSGSYGGFRADVPMRGELATFSDFSYAKPACNFGLDGTPEGEGRLTEEECIAEWASNSLGGPQLNTPDGAHVMMYAPEVVQLQGPIIYHGAFGVEEIDVINDSGTQSDVYITDIKLENANIVAGFDAGDKPRAKLRLLHSATEPVGNSKILDESHFGWKIADCNQCHNEQKNPLGHGGQSWPINYADGFDYPQPYYCSTCHGNNGASNNHGRGARCFWCHNNEGEMSVPNHGDISTNIIIPGDELVTNRRTIFSTQPNDDFSPRFFEELSQNVNNDYSFSRTFPEPYACVTCHK